MLRAAALAALFCLTLGVTPAPSPVPHDAAGIIRKMVERNPSLASYRARLHVNVRMLNFPYLAPQLDGTSYFKRPNNYEIVFDRVPSYAKGFSRLFDDIGDPSAWSRDQDVVFAGEQQLDGRPMLLLRMTKKIHSDILAYTLAFVDPQEYTVARMEWHYTSGGVIAMTQQYRDDGSYSLIVSQHATIDIPHVRAVADASYDEYQTNVAVDDTVFTGK